MTVGILITNTGTPDAPTPFAVSRYLREFLSDKRIVSIPAFIWLPILYGLILPTRSLRSAKLYATIWEKEGSPMRVLMQKIADNLQQQLNDENYMVEVGMNYGSPSIAEGLTKLAKKNISQLLVLPLYPQYSNATTASSFDRVVKSIRTWRAAPSLKFIRDYYQNENYIAALAQSVANFWQSNRPSNHLLISFHGVPKRFIASGDPYQHQCEQTANLLAATLKLEKENWTLCYQSQFGYDKWIQPATQKILQTLAQRGVHDVDVVCPGFSVDCLETLEEISARGREFFLAAGGKTLRYIPALNATQSHIDVLLEIIKVC